MLTSDITAVVVIADKVQKIREKVSGNLPNRSAKQRILNAKVFRTSKHTRTTCFSVLLNN